MGMSSAALSPAVPLPSRRGAERAGAPRTRRGGSLSGCMGTPESLEERAGRLRELAAEELRGLPL